MQLASCSFVEIISVEGPLFRGHGYHVTVTSLDINLIKWKNHLYEMKRDVGMSPHEKEREQEDAYTKTESHS